MAFLLRFTGNENVTFASTINIPANNSDSFAYVFDINYNGNSNEVLFANPSSFNDSLRIANSTSIVFRAGSSNFTFPLTTALSTGRQILKIKKSAFDVAVYDANNNALSAVQTAGMTNNIFGFGEDSQNRNFSGDLYSAKIYSDFNETTLVHNFDADASGGTGTTLDNLATPANSGTLNNFTGATNSWWVSYSTGTTASIIETGPSFTDAISSTVAGNISTSIAEFGPIFTDAITINVVSTGSISASIAESGPSFTDAIASTATGNITASILNNGPSFIDSVASTVTGNIMASVVGAGPSFTDSISISVTTPQTINVSIIEAGPSFIESILMSGPTKWTDRAQPATSWADRPQPTTVWTDSSESSTIWTDR